MVVKRKRPKPLLAVIIILAVISLIATPVILDVIEDAKLSTAQSESKLILHGINNYCATSVMKDQLNNTNESICNNGVTKEEVGLMVDLGNAHVNDIEYINKEEIELVISSNGYICTLKENKQFDCISDDDVVLNDKNSPTISFGNVAEPNSNGWYKENFYIPVIAIDNETKVSYKWCVDITECDPISQVNNGNGNILIETESDSNYACVKAIDEALNEAMISMPSIMALNHIGIKSLLNLG